MQQSTNSGNKKTIIFGMLAVLFFGAAYYPVFQILGNKWANSEEYSHAFLTLPIILYMAWGKKRILLERDPQYAPFGLLFVILAMGFYYLAMLTQVHTLISLSLFFTIVGVLVYLTGMQSVQILFTPLLLLLLLIPVPEQLFIKLTFPLQLKVSQVSELIVGMFGVPVLREGNVMNIPGKSFEVVEACSGLRSMITLLTLSLIMGYFMLERKTSKLILLFASIPTAIFANIIRVSSMILLYHFFRLDLTEGILHTVTGVLVFVIALVLLLFIHKVLEFWETK